MRYWGAHQRQRGVATAINDRQPEDDPEFPKERVSEECADDWQNVKRRDECVIPSFGLVRRHHREIPGLVHEIFRHENGEDPIHAVVGEPFGGLIADDVGHTRGHRCDFGWRSQIFFPGHIVFF